MKVTLVVASGVHQGKVIPVSRQQFLIGRDPECQLRPASQAVSKQHCAILIRDGKVFVKDFGSTNGTFINDKQLPADSECEIQSGDKLKLGPLDFVLQITQSQSSDATPLPNALQTVATKKPASSAAQKPVQGATPTKPLPVPPARSLDDADQDTAAAMLLSMGDEEPGTEPKVPGGSTVMDLTSINLVEGGSKPDQKSDEKKSAEQAKEDSSSAANEILRRYMRRPR